MKGLTMKHNQLRGLLALCLFATANAPATVLYVDANSADQQPCRAGGQDELHRHEGRWPRPVLLPRGSSAMTERHQCK